MVDKIYFLKSVFRYISILQRSLSLSFYSLSKVIKLATLTLEPGRMAKYVIMTPLLLFSQGKSDVE